MMFGALLGIWLGFVFAFILRDPIYDHIKCLVADDDDVKYFGKAPLITLLTIISLASVGGYAYWAAK